MTIGCKAHSLSYFALTHSQIVNVVTMTTELGAEVFLPKADST